MSAISDGGSKYLWNVGKLLPDYAVLQPRREPSSYMLPWEPQILHLKPNKGTTTSKQIGWLTESNKTDIYSEVHNISCYQPPHAKQK
jgi:hypothetical protein